MVEKIEERTFRFAVAIVTFVRGLPRDTAGYAIGRQLIRSGTSIGANFEEAMGGFSPEDFLYKASLAYKEARETLYWLRVVRDSQLVNDDMVTPLVVEALAISKILRKTVETARLNTKSAK